MNRIRMQRAAGQLLASASMQPTTRAVRLSACSICASALQRAGAKPSITTSRRYQSTTTTASSDNAGPAATEFLASSASSFSPLDSSSSSSSKKSSSTLAPGQGPSKDPRFPELFPEAAASPPYPSPLPSRAHSSAKLAALHARLALSKRLPLETLARTLVDASADPSPRFNNASLAYVGSTLINFHTSEWLLCRYPRLPMMILYAAMKAYAGPQALADVARQWGVEAAAVPGAEVDPGLLQYSLSADRQVIRRWGYQRTEAKYLKKFKWRHGISSRVVFDDDFGDVVDEETAAASPENEQTQDQNQNTDVPKPGSTVALGGSLDAAAKQQIADMAHANFVRAVAGAIYSYNGREAVRAFVRSHVLSRQLDLERFFRFKLPTRELSYLCAREGFAPPVARLEAETGRFSRTPVYVVGIYSGADKLGEGAAASLDHARAKAAMNSLKAWYLYSPGDDVRVPSDMLIEGAKPWVPAYVDIGEIL